MPRATHALLLIHFYNTSSSIYILIYVHHMHLRFHLRVLRSSDVQYANIGCSAYYSRTAILHCDCDTLRLVRGYFFWANFLYYNVRLCIRNTCCYKQYFVSKCNVAWIYPSPWSASFYLDGKVLALIRSVPLRRRPLSSWMVLNDWAYSIFLLWVCSFDIIYLYEGRRLKIFKASTRFQSK